MYLCINFSRLLIYGLLAGIFLEKRFSSLSGAFSATALSVLPGFGSSGATLSTFLASP